VQLLHNLGIAAAAGREAVMEHVHAVREQGQGCGLRLR
jgi:hypothetical protein